MIKQLEEIFLINETLNYSHTLAFFAKIRIVFFIQFILNEVDKSMDKNQQRSKIDYTIVFVLILLMIISAVAIYSAPLPAHFKTANFHIKQIMWYAVGALGIVAVMIIDYDRLRHVTWYIYGIGVALLLGLSLGVPGTVTRKGATSWYNIPGFGEFQPSELMKLFLIITLSHIIAKHNETYPIRTIREDLLLVGKIALASLLPLALILKQPDLGTTLVLVAIIFTLILVSGVNWKIIVTMVLSAVLFIAVLTYIYFVFPQFFPLEKYQLNRIISWFDPYEYEGTIGFQLVKSLQAVGSGGLYGRGYEAGIVGLPEAHTDFIFGVIAEEFGFIGASFVISLFFILIYRMIHIAIESNDPFGSYLSAGIVGMITFQIFENIGMGVQLLPITGIPLPFLSYGGSSLLTSMLAIGLVLNVRSRTRKFMFD